MRFYFIHEIFRILINAFIFICINKFFQLSFSFKSNRRLFDQRKQKNRELFKSRVLVQLWRLVWIWWSIRWDPRQWHGKLKWISISWLHRKRSLPNITNKQHIWVISSQFICKSAFRVTSQFDDDRSCRKCQRSCFKLSRNNE